MQYEATTIETGAITTGFTEEQVRAEITDTFQHDMSMVFDLEQELGSIHAADARIAADVAVADLKELFNGDTFNGRSYVIKII